MQLYKLNSIKERWASFSSSEQCYLKIGAIVVGIALIYFLILSPLIQSVTTLRESIHARSELIVWMQNANNEIKMLSRTKLDRKTSLSPIELMSVLQTQIAQAGLKEQVSQLKQGAKDSVELHFKKVEFDKLLSMLIKMSRAQAFSIAQVTVKSEKLPGMVKADIVFAI